MQIIDLLVIVAYLVATAWLGLALSGKQSSLKCYFLGGRDLPWFSPPVSAGWVAGGGARADAAVPPPE